MSLWDDEIPCPTPNQRGQKRGAAPLPDLVEYDSSGKVDLFKSRDFFCDWIYDPPVPEWTPMKKMVPKRMSDVSPSKRFAERHGKWIVFKKKPQVPGAFPHHDASLGHACSSSVRAPGEAGQRINPAAIIVID